MQWAGRARCEPWPSYCLAFSRFIAAVLGCLADDARFTGARPVPPPSAGFASWSRLLAGPRVNEPVDWRAMGAGGDAVAGALLLVVLAPAPLAPAPLAHASGDVVLVPRELSEAELL